MFETPNERAKSVKMRHVADRTGKGKGFLGIPRRVRKWEAQGNLQAQRLAGRYEKKTLEKTDKALLGLVNSVLKKYLKKRSLRYQPLVQSQVRPTKYDRTDESRESEEHGHYDPMTDIMRFDADSSIRWRFIIMLHEAIHSAGALRFNLRTCS